MVSFFHEDLASLYKLIERLLHLSKYEETQIIAGKLPAIFPDDIPALTPVPVFCLLTLYPSLPPV